MDGGCGGIRRGIYLLESTGCLDGYLQMDTRLTCGWFSSARYIDDEWRNWVGEIIEMGGLT